MIRIGTRGSALARWQASQVRRALEPHEPVEVVVVETAGDRDRATALHPLPVRSMVPAPGQAAVGVQMRRSDPMEEVVAAAFHDEATARAVTAERRLMSLLEGGCQLPLGAHVFQDGGSYRLLAALAPPPAPGQLP
ncbi:MAG: hypothetical protein JRI68_14950, partial [Deltaproteobacteria bacterium]|nr:hypothetical protein [Deltaproteobacteria bacterium]